MKNILSKTNDPKNHETLERFKRWPSLKKNWLGSKVRILSNEHFAYWGKKYSGYTCEVLDSGIYDFEDAFNHTFHCCEQKKIEYKKI